MKPHLPKLLLAAAAAAALTSVASAQATIIYRETFSNTTNGANFASVGWNAYWNATAVDRTAPANTSGSALSSGAVTGSATSNIGQAAPGGLDTGFAFIGATGITSAFAFTTEYNGTPISSSSLSAISFYQGNNASTSTFYAAVRVNNGETDTWYVSPSQAGDQRTATQYQEGNGVTLTFSDFSSNNWSVLNFTAGSTLSIGATTTLPTGTVTAFGLYATFTSGQNIRFDDFTVSAIPEPSSFAALAGLAGLGMAASRRRRR